MGLREETHLGARLRRLRVARGLTQKDLATPHYTHAYVSQIEAGKRRPSPGALEHFAARLEVGLEELTTGRPPDLTARLTLALHEARLALSHGKKDESRTILDRVLREATRFRLTPVRAQAEAALALVLEQTGQLEDAINGYERAESILAREAGNERAYAVAGQARCHHMLGDIRYAIHLLESLLDEMKEEGLQDPDALVRLYSPLVLAYFDAGLFERANATATEAMRLSIRVTDPSNVAAMHVNVARVLLHQGRYAQAERSLRRAENLYQDLDYPTEGGIAHLARGYVLTRRGQLDQAEEELKLARSMLRRSRSTVNQAHALNELARVKRLKGRVDEAEKLLHQAMALLVGDSDSSALAWAHRELGICRAENDPRDAEKSYRTAIELYERAGEKLELASTYRRLGDLLDGQGRAPDAATAYREGLLRAETDL